MLSPFGLSSLVEVEVARQRPTIDFGEVDPFGDEDPAHEKY